MFRYFTENLTRKYNDVLDTLVDQQINTVHSSIKMTPMKASRKENENKVWRNLYSDFGGNTKIFCGDNVRMTMKKIIFEKEYTPILQEGEKRF